MRPTGQNHHREDVSHVQRLRRIDGRLGARGHRLRRHLDGLAFWPARVAHRKGHGFIGYFVFSLFFFALALITAYLVHDRRQPAY